MPNINLYVKSIETLARALLTLNILSIGAVEAVDALLPEVEKKTFGFLMNLTVELHYSLSFMM